MKTNAIRVTVTTLLMLGALYVMIPGCEDDPSLSALDRYFEDNPFITDPRTDPSASDLELSPSSATAEYINQEILFRVVGGQPPYNWDTSVGASGSVDDKDDDGTLAIYKVIQLTENEVIVADARGLAAIASIEIASITLAIAPTSVSIPKAGGDTVVFTATGGSPPYTWQIVFPVLETDGTVGTSGANDQTGRAAW